jgi:hypothetical protein
VAVEGHGGRYHPIHGGDIPVGNFNGFPTMHRNYLKGMFLIVVSMHGWKDDVISDNLYVGLMP